MNQIKRIALLCLVLLGFCASGVQAQNQRNGKVTVVMREFNYTPTAQQQHKQSRPFLETIAQAALQGLNEGLNGKQPQTNVAKYDVLRAAVVKGMADAHRVSAIDAETAGTTVHGDYAVDATVSSLVIKDKVTKVDGRNKTSYKAVIDMVMHVKNGKTGKIVKSPVIKVAELDVVWADTKEKALQFMLKELNYEVTKFFNNWFPISGNVLEGASAKGDKQKEVYIDLGSASGAEKGLHLDIYSVKNVAGQQARLKIGRLKIESIAGDNISLCKITNGAKEVKSALDSKVQLVVASTE